MNIGDRVRLMHGKEEGIITRFLDNNLVEVAIDNDFTIPVMRREVVVIAAEEGEMFRNVPAPEAPKKAAPPVVPSTAVAGIYIALVHQTDELLAVHIVNNSEFDLLFTYGEETDKGYKAQNNDKLVPKKTKPVAHLHLNDFEKWPDLVVQYLQHKPGSNAILEPVTRKLKFKASSFYKSKKTAPVLQKEGYVFQLDSKPTLVNPDMIQEQLTESAGAGENLKVAVPNHEVDLHIEKILPNEDPKLMSNSEILRQQLSVFQDNLDRALAANMHEIIFIHGTGNGVLKKEIQKVLSRNPHIKFYEDARKEKFGYGATRVQLK
ncbi:DNA mismatch repair protein MutS [Rufibacter radiotolerans]|uniref:DNA mismatch repair protein MutS n=1 Tax=Rufibacter radiotolerans TaxID=1379910 RepID=A0A0H4VNQ1_9BACT|nr:Smr/MutS family protein [Rufibacter radiotolerans]AKQ45364.1 DNA mismatch repair protein MutS [Rufibacter radiotolerans]